MNKNILFIALIVILVAIIGVAAYMMMTPSADSQVGDQGTKFAIENNGTTWAHVDMIIQNATLKNGTVQNFYIETWMKPYNGTVNQTSQELQVIGTGGKPVSTQSSVFVQNVNGTVVIDLSKLLGYGNEKLPAGTSIRVIGWKGLYNSTTPIPTQNLNISMSGWSNTLNPPSNNTKYDVFVGNLTVGQLPANITNNTVFLGENLANVENLNGLRHFNELVYEEEVFTVNADGSVSIVFTKTPALCELVAKIP
ncbi:MAG: hypothetical protein Q7U35_07225 [Methanobacteriaceae archaeon]|nr:hypothetical protein [Methanobacteriaceae archaeon]